MPIRVLLADDHDIVRQGLRSLIQGQRDMLVVAEAREGRAAVRLATETRPDVVVMDLAMPGLNGAEATRQIKAKNPAVGVVILTAHGDHRLAGGVLAAGAEGFVLKEAAFEELASAIRTVVGRKTYICRQVAAALVAEGAGAADRNLGDVLPGLTAREREVLQLTAEGKAMKEIAAILNVSVKTIETHRRQLMAKLDIDNVAGLTKYAIRAGVTSLN
jgi:DNA-binding NarL/FixJ family response regulator